MRTLAVTRKGGILFAASFSTFFCLLLYLHINNPRIKFVEIPSLSSETKWSYGIQAKRLQKIEETCQDFLGAEGQKSANFYGGRAPFYEQKLGLSAFLIAEKPKTVLCYNHKVASSTWMSTFAKLLHDEKYFKVHTQKKPFMLIDFLLIQNLMGFEPSTSR